MVGGNFELAHRVGFQTFAAGLNSDGDLPQGELLWVVGWHDGSFSGNPHATRAR
jgi:hypothetical protein